LRAFAPEAASRALLALAVGLLLIGVLDPQGTDWSEVPEQSMLVLLNGLIKEKV
jgi:hypothetical protein